MTNCVYVIMKINFSLYVKMKKKNKRSEVQISRLKAQLSAFRLQHSVLMYKLITRYSLLVTLLLLFTVYYPLFTAHANEISAVNVKLLNNDIYVTAVLKPDQRFMNSIDEGISKEVVFYIDLFRVWSVWPDEFVTGRKIVRTLKSNPIKREYILTSLDGNVQIEKRFKDIGSMTEWAMSITDLKLTNFKELDSGTYFVKVTVESNIRKLPPVIGYLLFFVPEKEFSISRDSQTFQILK